MAFQSGTDLAGLPLSPELWLLGAARWLPSALLVPAFGAPGAPVAVRLSLAWALGVSSVGGQSPWASGSLGWAMLRELSVSVPVAIGAASVLWGASMAGALFDQLRGAPSPLGLGEERRVSDAPVSLLLGLLAAIAFLGGGGPVRIAEALDRAEAAFSLTDSASSVAHSCLAAIEVALAVAAPLVVAVIVLEVVEALVIRLAWPLVLERLFGPIKALALLFVLALLLERIALGLSLRMQP